MCLSTRVLKGAYSIWEAVLERDQGDVGLIKDCVLSGHRNSSVIGYLNNFYPEERKTKARLNR